MDTDSTDPLGAPASPSGSSLQPPAAASAAIPSACVHDWQATKHFTYGMYSKCTKCGEAKEEWWD